MFSRAKSGEAGRSNFVICAQIPSLKLGKRGLQDQGTNRNKNIAGRCGDLVEEVSCGRYCSLNKEASDQFYSHRAHGLKIRHG